MKKLNNFLLIVTVFTLIPSVLLGGEGDAGQAGELLRSGIGARGFSMGKAYTVMPEGGEGLIWNPAGLGKLGQWELNLMHAQGYLDSRLEFGSFAFATKKFGGFGAAFINEGVTKIDGRDDFNRPTGEMDWGESVAIVGWGKSFLQNKFYAGLTGKYVMKNMGDESANGLGGFDIGLLSKDFMFKYRFGLAVQNLGASEIAGDAYPMTIRAGVGYRLTRNIYITADGEMVSGRGISPRVGAEYRSTWFAVRAGYDVMKPEITFGVGFMLENIRSLAAVSPRLDYAGGAMGPIGNSYARISLRLMGEQGLPPADTLGDPCERLSEWEPYMNKRGFVGAKANLIYGGCRFKYEALEAPFDLEPNLEDIYGFFNEAYYGKYGSEWPTIVATDSLAKTVFSQKTHYMYAETKMSKSIDEETKALVEQLISAGGDSGQYDTRLQYDLAVVQDSLGEDDAALSTYKSIAAQKVESPIRVLSLYNGAVLMRDSDRDKAVDYLETIVNEFGVGFYEEDGSRQSYPMFPKYRDNSLVDESHILLADIIFSSAGDDEAKLRKALGLYLDVLMYYPDMESFVLKEAARKASLCYKQLGDVESADIMMQRSEEL